MSVGAIDLAILLVYMAGVVALGTWIGRRAHSVAEYMLGGRDLPWWVILCSIVATETSTVTFLSIPGFAYEHDLSWLQIPLGFLVGRYAVAYLLLPRYFSGSYFTAYQVLAERFGGATRQVASVLFVITRTLADGLRLFLSAIVLQEMTGLAIEWAVVVLGLTTIAYTFYGGMRSVLWTDVVQFLLYVTGAMVALGLILRGLPGGWGQLVAMAAPAGKLHLLDLGFHWDDATNLWAGLIGGAFIAMGSHGVDQMMVQRYLAARHLRDARRALTVSGVVVVLQFALFLIIGVGLWAFYRLSPPAVPFDRPDRVFARFILEQMPVGLLGLLLGAIFAAAMSTLSSSLNSCATAAADDLWRPWAGARSTETRELRVTRLLVVFFGVAQIAVGIGGRWLTESVINSILGIVAFTTGIVLGVFFLGIFTPRVGQRAALVGLVAGMAGMTWVYFATPLAWPWYALVGSAATVATGLSASLVWPREPSRRGEGELPV